ncbi:MAG: aminotransferase class IV [Verrucomicrobiota bacterium]
MPTSSLQNSAISALQIWLNGEVIPADEAAVSPFDHGLLTGDGVFETLIAYGGKAFAFSRHYERLKHSAQRFGLAVPAKEVLLEAANGLLETNGMEHARIRITITGGTAPLGSEKGEDSEMVIVAVGPLPKHGAEGHVVRVEWPRNEKGATAGLKTTSYGENVIALAHAKKNGGTEAIFGNTSGQLCEGTGSNIFVVRDDQLITPPLSSGCLAGVTRAIVLDLCEDFGLSCKETDTPFEELAEVDEAFLTSTLREVQPIATVDGKALKRVPGELTLKLKAAFKELTATTVDP